MTDTPTPRRRGAQPGNRNAVKHGFYVRSFQPAALKDLNRHDFEGLQDEINMLRLYMRQVIELAHSEPSNLGQSLEVLRVLALAAVGLTRLYRTHTYVTRELEPTMQEILTEALVELNKDITLG